jgi:hypothetical protein
MNWTNILTGAGVAGNVASTLITNEYNKEQQQRQNRWNLHLWDLQNQYNSPVEQMKRLQEAGLSPDMMYGGNSQNMGNASSQAVGSNPIAAQAPQIDPLMFQQIELMKAQKYKTQMEGDNVDKQNQILDETGLRKALAEIGYTEQQINESMEKVNLMHTQQDQIKKDIQVMDENINMIKEKVKEIQANVEKIDMEKMNLEELSKIYILQQEGLKLTNEQQKIITKNLDAIQKSQIALNYAQADKARKDADKAVAETAYTSAGTILVGQQTETEKAKRENINADTQKKKHESNLLKIDEKYRDAEKVTQIAKDGTAAIKNVTSAITDFLPTKTISNVTSNVTSNSTSKVIKG